MITSCRAQRAQVLALDGAAVAHVVAQHKRRQHVARRVIVLGPGGTAPPRLGRVGHHRKLGGHAGHAHLAHAGAQAHLPPQPVDHQRDLADQRPSHAHGEVIAGTQCVIAERGVVQVVDDVDAADERHFVIDHGDLAMQAAQVAALQAEAAHRPVRAPGRAGRIQHRRDAGGQRAGAEAVHGDAHFHAAPRRARQRLGHAAPGVIVGIDVGFQRDAATGGIDGVDKGGKERGASVQQIDPVAWQGLAPPPLRTQRPGIARDPHERNRSASRGT
ncbi:hypothetical protein LMG10661_01096 [Ralstonia syzygii subsp. syzygii]|nr:hypothetical protein LMG10661_01096 [Ralstonia syzygii subsp. syzygii]